MSAHSRRLGRQNTIDRRHTWQQYSSLYWMMNTLARDWRKSSMSRMNWSAQSPKVGILLVERHMLVPSPMPLLHSVALDRGRGNSLNDTLPSSPPGGPHSGRIPHAVYDVMFTAVKLVPTYTKQAFPILGIKHDKGKCMLFYFCCSHYLILAYTISACEVCIIWRKPTGAFKIHCRMAESRTVKPAIVTLKIQLDCFRVHGRTPMAKHICAQPFRMWNRPVFIRFCRSRKNCKDAKAMQINEILKWSSIWPGRLSLIRPKKQYGP